MLLKFLNRYKNVHYVLSVLSVCLFFIFGNVSFAYGESLGEANKPIRVGCYRIEDYAFSVEQDEFSGYAYELLSKLKHYNGNNYEFVYGTFEECVNDLAEGRIDLIAGMPRYNKSSSKFVLSNYPLAPLSGALVVNPEFQDLYYEDFGRFNGLKIGYEKSSVLLPYLEDYGEAHNFKLNYKSYDNIAPLLQDLRLGSLDGVLLTSMHDLRQNRVVAKLQPISTYFAAKEEQKYLLDDIDVAFGQVLAENSAYRGTLQEKYYNENALQAVLFTREEMQYMQSLPKLKVAYYGDAERAILVSYNKEADKIGGLAPEILNYISTLTGLQFELVKIDDANYYSSIKDNKADILGVFGSEGKINDLPDLAISEPYAKLPLGFLRNSGRMPTGEFKIAIVANRLGTYNSVKKSFPDAEIQSYPTQEEAWKAVVNNEADLYVDNIYILQKILQENKGSIKQIVPFNNKEMSISFAVGSEDKQLLRVLNKALAGLTPEKRDKMMTAVVAQIPHALTVNYILDKYIYELALIIVTIILLSVLYYFVIEKKNERSLARMAFYNKVTNIINFDRFIIDAERLLKSKKYVFVMFDLNNFYSLIALLGHDRTRSVLQKMSKEIAAELVPGELLAHGESDYFTCLLLDEGDEIITKRLLVLQSRLTVMGEREFYCKLAPVFGVYRPGNEIFDTEKMMNLADMARMKAKESKSVIEFYRAEYQEELSRAAEIEAKMETALQHKDFFVVYQPKYDLKKKCFVSAEALVRWCDDTGSMHPGEFIPLFERNGFIIKLDLYVFEEVCVQLRAWLDAGVKVLPIAVNFSRLHLLSTNFIEKYERIIKKYEIPAELLELELTEYIPLDSEAYVNTLCNLAKTGVHLALDDFGSGYSSLNILHKLPFVTLKLDKEFFKDKIQEEKGIHIVETIVLMAHKLGMVVVAEGVENEEQVNFLRSIDCDLVQGYYYSKPLYVNEFEALMDYK